MQKETTTKIVITELEASQGIPVMIFHLQYANTVMVCVCRQQNQKTSNKHVFFFKLKIRYFSGKSYSNCMYGNTFSVSIHFCLVENM